MTALTKVFRVGEAHVISLTISCSLERRRQQLTLQQQLVLSRTKTVERTPYACMMVGLSMARIWHRNKCLILSTAYLASVAILTLSHRALSGSHWEGMENWTRGNTDCECQTVKWNASNVLKSLCGPTADLRGPGMLFSAVL